MAALIGTIIAFTTFGIVLKLAGVLGLRPAPIAFVNYVFAALVSLVLLARAPEGAGPPLLWAIGGTAGLMFVLGFFVNYRAIEVAGLSVAQPVASVAVVLPIAASIVLWGERPTLPQAAAIVAACAALVLLSSGHGRQNASPDGKRPGHGRAWGVLAGLFLVQGAVMLAPKVVEEAGLGGYRWGYLASLFLVASVASGVQWRRTAEPLTLPGVGLGLTFGAANVAATVLLLVALQQLPGILVYPATSVGNMLTGALIGVAVWSERPGRLALAGMALAVPAVFLLNI